MSAKKHVYMFTETDASMRNLLGGKGLNLGLMTQLKLPIPQGFTVSTEVCTSFYENGKRLSEDVIAQIEESMAKLEKITGKEFGNPINPLLVSVRSGARVSMPGMMDTILNLGLNEIVVEGLAQTTKNPRFAYDSYRRFVQMYSDVVMGLSRSFFEEVIEEMKQERGIALDTEFTTEDFKEMIEKFKSYYKEELGEKFPENPREQLFGAINAVFRSWQTPRANYYRKINHIPNEWGTAVNVQAMVYGNMGQSSGTGVAFTRNPATGEKKIYGEYLINAQGEDVVSGVRTPSEIETLKEIMPKAYEEFIKATETLEAHFKDMQDIEFTIENNKLYLLQTRSGKRTAQAALKIAVDLFNEKMVTKEEALMLVQPEQLESLLHPQFNQASMKKVKPIGKGLPASPGAATGHVAFDVEEAVKLHKEGKKVILVRSETSPEDIEGMHISEGFLTARGGMTSHAAVVARGMGKCCVSGCHELIINYKQKYFELDGKRFNEEDFISLDGSTGNIYGEKIDTVPATISGDFKKFMQWCDEVKKLDVRTNADTPADAKQAREFGAQGIGLCRTEHMFFDSARIKAMREMIVADTSAEREKALAKLLPMQRQDFEELYEAMGNYPVTIRYLDPPLHEFLPSKAEDIRDIAKELGLTIKKLKAKIDSLHEFNPMMGHRGCRLAVSYPELAKMQTRAVMEAYCTVKKKNPKYTPVPEIMIPLIGDVKEFVYVKNIVRETADSVLEENKMKVDYKVGTMIEIPRATLLADEIAKEADFFSFGTNDLTQMTYGFSRDDSSSFLNAYYEKKIYESDPFARLDQHGVGVLVEMATRLGREGNPKLHVGVCGEHGGDPSSIEFFHKVGLDYVSCSPFRVPIARLAAAQAVIKEMKK